MPVPAWVSAPVPEMTPAMVTAVGAVERQGGVVGDVAGASEPVVPPLPTCRVPAEMVVAPL